MDPYLVSLAAAVGVWAVRQEGRVNGHDELFKEREKTGDERQAEIVSRLTRIESILLEGKRKSD